MEVTSVRWMAALLAAAAWTAPAAAQQQIGGGLTVTGSVTGTTDYRFRGISQSNGDPAVQASIGLDHESGFYASGFASSLSDDIRPGEYELSGYVGYTREIAAGTDIDVGLQLYGYPDNQSLTDASYFEPYAAVRHTLGPVTAELGAAYAPEQEALADNDSLYVYGDLTGGVPFRPITIKARLGYTSGPARFTGLSDYLDWRVGAEYTRGPARLSLEYVDTDIPAAPDADGALVASLRLGF
jgi:uncharacterized protein (TIGR02001 family)